MNDLSPDRTEKFRAFRERKKAAGMRQLRLWVPDMSLSAIQQRIASDLRAIAASADERDMMAWIEAETAAVWNDLD